MLWICSQSTPPTHLTACVATWWRSLFSSWSSPSLIFSFCYKTAFTLSLSSYYDHICAVSSYCHHIFFIYSHHCMIIWLSGCPSWETPWCELSPCLRHLWQCAEHVSLEYTGLELLLGLWPLSFWIFRIWSLSRCLKLTRTLEPFSMFEAKI